MGNPRRDAIEYGVFITLATSMAAAYAFLIAYSNQKSPDGTKRGLPRVDINAKVDLGELWEEMKREGKGILSGQQLPPQQRPGRPVDGSNNGGVSGGQGDQSKK